VISDLQSPEENPAGYGAAAVGTATAAVLLIPAAVFFHGRLSRVRRKVAWAGTALFATGLATAVAIGVLAPFTRDYTPVHIQLAFAAFTGVCGGTLAWWIVAALGAREPWMMALAAVQCGVLLFLVYLYFTPHFFHNQGLLTSLAFWEWVLCADCAVSLWLLAAGLERLERLEARGAGA